MRDKKCKIKLARSKQEGNDRCRQIWIPILRPKEVEAVKAD